MLTEAQIQRYARQLLLRDVGERGQEALGAIEVDLSLGGAVAAAAAAYLRAGGTEVHLASPRGAPWAPTPPLLEPAPPRARLHVVAVPGAPERAGVVVGSAGGGQVLWSIADDGCRACLRRVTGTLVPPDVPEPTSVQAGSLLALLVQRRALGLAAALEGLELSRTGVLSALTAETCTHRPPAVPDPCWPSSCAIWPLRSRTRDARCWSGATTRLRVAPMENAQTAQHARDPEAFPRTAPNRLQPRPPRLAVAPPGSRPGGGAHSRHRPLAPRGRPALLGGGSPPGRPRRTAPPPRRGAPGHRLRGRPPAQRAVGGLDGR